MNQVYPVFVMQFPRTMPIAGSDEVMAYFSPERTYLRSRWQDIRVTEYPTKSLVGLIVPTIFSVETFWESGFSIDFPSGTRFAYAGDIVNALIKSKNYKTAFEFDVEFDELGMFAFKPENYEPVLNTKPA